MIDITTSHIINNFEEFNIPKYSSGYEFISSPDKYRSNNQIRLKNSKFYKFSSVDELVFNYEKLKTSPKLRFIEKASLWKEYFMDIEKVYFEDLDEYNIRARDRNTVLLTDFSEGLLDMIQIHVDAKSIVKRKDFELIECEVYDDSGMIPAVYVYREPLSKQSDYETLNAILQSNPNTKFNISFRAMDDDYLINSNGMKLLRGKKLLLTFIELNTEHGVMNQYVEEPLDLVKQ